MNSRKMSKMSASDHCATFRGEILQDSGKALRVKFLASGKWVELWVPHSCVHDDSEIWKAGESGYIKVSTWWAEKNLQ